MSTPNHIGIIPDGNRRWAKQHGLPSFEGHRRGAKTISSILKKARELNIKVVSFWAFSTENWHRKPDEVRNLMILFEETISSNIKDAVKNKTRIIHLGRKDRLTEKLKRKLDEAEEKTKEFTDHYFALALDYGGRDEVTRAIQKMQTAGLNQQTEDDFNQFLDTKDLPYPNPDLIIRTSGEQRTSGYLIWQSVYAEYMYVEKCFPEFTVDDFDACVKDYEQRERRFGK